MFYKMLSMSTLIIVGIHIILESKVYYSLNVNMTEKWIIYRMHGGINEKR